MIWIEGMIWKRTNMGFSYVPKVFQRKFKGCTRALETVYGECELPNQPSIHDMDEERRCHHMYLFLVWVAMSPSCDSTCEWLVIAESIKRAEHAIKRVWDAEAVVPCFSDIARLGGKVIDYNTIVINNYLFILENKLWVLKDFANEVKKDSVYILMPRKEK